MTPSPVDLVQLLAQLSCRGFFWKGICDICVACAQHARIATLYYGQTVVCVNDLKQFVAEQDRSWWESPNIMKEIFSDFQR